MHVQKDGFEFLLLMVVLTKGALGAGIGLLVVVEMKLKCAWQNLFILAWKQKGNGLQTQESRMLLCEVKFVETFENDLCHF